MQFSNNIAVIMGRHQDGRDVIINLVAPHHIALTGRTRSGKSVALYTILAQLRQAKNVIVAGIDPSGIVFNALGQHLGGSRYRALTIRDAQRCQEVLRDLVEEMDARIEQLLSRRLDKFERFSSECPLLLVVLEEYPGTLAALDAHDKATGARSNERVEPQVRALIQRLALEGAKVGIRLVVVAQRADAAILTGVLRSQLAVKLTFAQDRDGIRMLHPDLEADLLEEVAQFQPGQGIIELPGKRPERFKGDFITYQNLLQRFPQ